MRKREILGVGIGILMMVQASSFSFAAQSNSPSQAYFSSIYDYLCAEYQKNNPPSLYENALLGLAFLALGETNLTQNLVENGVTKLEESEEGLAGPRLWDALLILHYESVTNDSRFHLQAEQVCRWYLSLPRYQGLPAISDTEQDGIPWPQIVSLEDAPVGAAVLRLMAKTTPDSLLKNEALQEAENLEQQAARWGRFPKGVLLLMAFSRDGNGENANFAEKMKTYQLDEGIVLVADTEKEKSAAARYLNRSVENILEWREENAGHVYDSCGALFGANAGEWFYPAQKLHGSVGNGVISVCWDLFRKSWNPLSLEKPTAVVAKLQDGKNNPVALFETARIHLLAGENQKAEALAQSCVDLAGNNPAYADAVASAWLILGKIYHDRSQTAGGQFKFEMADQFKTRRDLALRRIQNGYPTATVADSSGFFSYVVDVVKKLYN